MSKRGRPVNFNIDEIKQIINEYVRFTNGQTLITASSVADYASNKLHIKNFKYYVINRNAEAKEYLNGINEKIKTVNKEEGYIEKSIYNPIDVSAYIKKNPEEQKIMLMNINKQIEYMSDKYADIIKDNVSLRCEIKESKEAYKRMCEEYEEKIIKLKNNLKDTEENLQNTKKHLIMIEENAHLIWDNEAEKILVDTRIIEGDECKPNKKMCITDIESNVHSITEKAHKNKLRFIDKLYEI